MILNIAWQFWAAGVIWATMMGFLLPVTSISKTEANLVGAGLALCVILVLWGLFL
jgi:hypothetical protein